MPLLMQDSNLKNELSKHGPFVKTAGLTFYETSKPQKALFCVFRNLAGGKFAFENFLRHLFRRKETFFHRTRIQVGKHQVTNFEDKKSLAMPSWKQHFQPI